MVESPPVISIIATCYNHERFVVESLESIHKLNGIPFELIFCDDCSTDESANIAKEWLNKHHPSAIRVFNKKNMGLCATLNKALKLAKGKYFKIVACDDNIIADGIPVQVSKLENSDPDVVMCCGNYDQINEESKLIRKSIYPESYQLPKDIFLAIIQKHMVFSPQTAVWQKSVFDEIGGFDESYSAEGFQTWLKIFFDKYSAIYLPMILAHYRIVQNSFSHSGTWDAKFAEQRIRTLKQYDCDGERGEAIRKRFQKEYLTLVKHAYHCNEVSEARKHFQEFLRHTLKEEKSDIENKVLNNYWSNRFPLLNITQFDSDFIKAMIFHKEISTGSYLLDYLLKWNLYFILTPIDTLWVYLMQMKQRKLSNII